MIKAADLTNETALKAIIATREYWGVSMLWEIQGFLKDFPTKIVKAKLKKLIEQGLVNGCACGCRGDFVVTASGFALIKGENK
jgi:hypothetical protein